MDFVILKETPENSGEFVSTDIAVGDVTPEEALAHCVGLSMGGGRFALLPAVKPPAPPVHEEQH